MPDTNWLREQELKHRVGLATFTPPANWFVGLSSTLPTLAGGNVTEPVGAGYARTQIDAGALGWSFATDQVSNTDLIEIGPSTGSWLVGATIPYLCVFNAATAGTLAAWGVLTDARVVNASGITVTIAIGELDWKRLT